jgi:hypothetical protein
MDNTSSERSPGYDISPLYPLIHRSPDNLQAICAFPTVFAGALSLYGISHLKSLIKKTHEFEFYYAERLLFEPGTFEEERAAIIEERSPF